MSAQPTFPTAPAATSTQAVVLHDKSTGAQGVMVTFSYLEQLTIERQVWEDNAFRTSNEQLYVLLQKCYQFYELMCTATAEADALRKGLNDYISLKGYNFAKTNHTLAKIVKCVFGADRRRVSAYSIALRKALEDRVQVLDIPSYIRNAGGVEELRKDDAKGESSTQQKVLAAKEAVNASTLCVASGVQLASHLDGGKVGTQVVLIGSWQADGSVVVRAVVESDSVLNAALSSYYSSNKKKLSTSAVEAKAANDANAVQAAIQVAVSQAA